MSIKSIPQTSVSTYISGIHSLNLDLEDGTGFDWHFSNYWMDGSIPIKLYGAGTLIDTNPIYGYYGVANREERLNKLGLQIKKVYVANHHRAILDFVFESLSRFNRIGYAKGCVRDFFFDSTNAQQLFNHLVKMFHYLDEDTKEVLNDWLSREFRPFYKAWQARAVQSGKDIFDVTDFDENVEVFLRPYTKPT